MSRIRADGPTRTFMLGTAVEVPLPSPAELKARAREAIVGFAMPPADRQRAEELLDACAFDYEVVAGRDGIVDVLGLVIFTDDDHARILTEWLDPDVCSCLMSALGSVCPDLGSDRVVVQR